MEQLLSLYSRAYESRYPVVCLDEKIVYLLHSMVENWPMRVGSCEKQDYEYVRSEEVSRNLFVVVEPLLGWRHLTITSRRTNQDYAHLIKWLVDEVYWEALEIQLVQDNLNTHGPAALYQTFPPEEAQRLMEKIRWYYTPKHASWLNMAEIEISVFERGCLGQRIGSEATLVSEVAALEQERNAKQAKINWQFNCELARSKLHRLYPKLETL